MPRTPADANSEEFDKNTPNKVVIFMPEVSKTHMGGTMRLGSRPTHFAERHAQKSIMRQLYGNKDVVHERHRHRYEVNINFVKQFEEKGLMFVGEDDKHERMEILELAGMIVFVVRVRVVLALIWWLFFTRLSSPCLFPLRHRPPVLRGHPVPPRVQVAPAHAIPALPRLDPCRIEPARDLPRAGETRRSSEPDQGRNRPSRHASGQVHG